MRMGYSYTTCIQSLYICHNGARTGPISAWWWPSSGMLWHINGEDCCTIVTLNNLKTPHAPLRFCSNSEDQDKITRKDMTTWCRITKLKLIRKGKCWHKLLIKHNSCYIPCTSSSDPSEMVFDYIYSLVPKGPRWNNLSIPKLQRLWPLKFGNG